MDKEKPVITPLVVSCPCCNKESTLEMEFNSNQDFPKFLSELFFNAEIKQYTFHGNSQCTCGKFITATLTVTGGEGKNERKT